METNSGEAVNGSDITPLADGTLDFDDDTLKAIAEVYSIEGDKEYNREHFSNAIYFYTEGIKVHCKDDKMNAFLYAKRAAAYLFLGNVNESLNDLKTGAEMQQLDDLKATLIGLGAAFKLRLNEDGNYLCDSGSTMIGNKDAQLESRNRSFSLPDFLRKMPLPTNAFEGDNEDTEIFKVGALIAKDVKDVASGGNAVRRPVNNYDSLENGKKALNYSEIENRAEEGATCSNADAEDFKRAKNYLAFRLSIAKEVGNRAAEARANVNIGDVHFSVGDCKTARDYYEVSLQIAKEVGNRDEEATACEKLGDVYFHLEDFKKAVEYYGACLKFSKEVGNRKAEGNAYFGLSGAYSCLGDNQRVIHYGDRYLTITKDVGNRPKEVIICACLGDAYACLGDFKKAIDYHEQRLKMAIEMGIRFEECRSYESLCFACNDLGDFKKAAHYFELLITVAKELGVKVEGVFSRNLGLIYLKSEHFKKAREYIQLNLQIPIEVENKSEEIRAYSVMGISYHRLGYFEKAIECHEFCLKLAKEVGDTSQERTAYSNLADAYFKLSDFKKAVNFCELYLKIVRELGYRAEEGRAMERLGDAYFRLGNFKAALGYHESQLRIAEEAGEKHEEANAHCKVGCCHRHLGNVREALHQHKLYLSFSKELGERREEGLAHNSLGVDFYSIGHFKEAIESHELQLEIAKELGDKEGERMVYCNLGNDYRGLGNFKKAKRYYELELKLAKELGDKALEGGVYANLGIVYRHLKDFRKAIGNHQQNLKIAREVGDRASEGRAYGNLGIVYLELGDFQKALEYHELCLQIAIEVGDKAVEGHTHANIGDTYSAMDNFEKSLDYHKRHLEIANEVGDEAGKGIAFFEIGQDFEATGFLCESLDFYKSSVKTLNDVRARLESKDEWKIDLRNHYKFVYTALWRVLLKQDKIEEALFAAEQGRAQALKDLMNSSYGVHSAFASLSKQEEENAEVLIRTTSSTVFSAISRDVIYHWVFQKERTHLRKVRSVDHQLQTLVGMVREIIGVRAGVKCEDRSLEKLRNTEEANEGCDQNHPDSPKFQESPLRTLYELTIGPLKDLVHGDELIVVPDGPLWLAPYAAFLDSNSKYLSESFRIRAIPSLTIMRLLEDCPEDYHNKSGALLVGDPWVQDVTNAKGQRLKQLQYARDEVEIIGRILNTMPLTGVDATKDEVLKRLPTVALVHIAAHGRMETGEIALTPNPTRPFEIPGEEDYLLTMADLLEVKLRARLVVLSCCHSGRGEIKSEGVVGIARAFLGAGARSVLVSLWAIDDEATLEFMKTFYQYLLNGRRASEALSQAMKSMRESDRFSEVKYWAPFVLIGDDVTLEFGSS